MGREYPHQQDEYQTCTVQPDTYVPDRFTYDDLVDLGQKVNYIYRDGNDVFRVSIHKDTTLFTVWFYAKSEANGRSKSVECREPDQLMQVRDSVLTVFDGA